MIKSKLHAIDFFCSGGGMTHGLRKAGVQVRAGIDIDPSCKETYELNNPGSIFVLADVFKLRESFLEKELQVKRNDDSLVLVGCSPCQYWSVIRTDKSKSKATKHLLGEFLRFVLHFRPGYVLVENVPGILSRQNQSGLDYFVDSLRTAGYAVKYENIDLNEYGVAQTRRRFSLVATRLHREAFFPKPRRGKRVNVKDVLGKNNGFPNISAGNMDPSKFSHTTYALSDRNLRRIRRTRKNGGSRFDWSEDSTLSRDKYLGRGFPDNYGRMSWDRPAPTITTRFLSISNGRFGHPEEDRALSIREGATLQTFPKSYEFVTDSLSAAARIIGNAVPPLFAEQLGRSIIRAHKTRRK